MELWNVEGLTTELRDVFGLDLPLAQWLEDDQSLYE